MNIARFFIDRPVFAAVLSIVIVIAGAIALVSLPISQYPEIAPPTVTVTANFPGANAKTVAESVATPIEEQINGVEHMLYMSSQNTNDGSMNLTITFAVGTNLDTAQVQVQNRVSLAIPQLPQEVQRLGVTVKKASPDISVVVNLFSPNQRFDTVFLSNYATLQIRDELARLPGVGDIVIFGARNYAMRLWLDPDKLATRGMTPGDVTAAVREQNIQVAAGTIGGPPLPKGEVAFQYTVSALGRLTEPSQFEDIVVKTGPDGQVTRLGEVARIELAAADYGTALSFNNQPAVGIAIFQLPGSNALQTANRVYDKMRELKAHFPPGLDYNLPYDTTLFVRDSIKDVAETLLIAVALVALVVVVFLQSWRASLVPLLAIPVSLIGTFAVMWLVGFSFNMLTLFGLVLAIGIVVDDAIVVVENVQRWIELGHSPYDAAFKAMREVTPAVIAIAFGLSAVFIPVAFISGITGQFYRQFALTIAFSTLLSAFNSLTLSPALAALLLPAHDARPDWFTRILNFFFGWFFRFFNHLEKTVTRWYGALLARVMRWSAVALVAYVGLIGLAFLGFKSVPTGFIPTQDQGYLLVVVQMPDATSVDRTQALMTKISAMAAQIPGIKDRVAISGISMLTRANTSSAGAMFVVLEPAAVRRHNPAMSSQAIMGQLWGRFAQIQEGRVLVFPPPPVRGVGNAGGFALLVQDRSGTATPQELETATQKLIAAASQRPEVTGLFSSFSARVPQLYADIDRNKVKQQNVPLSNVFEALQIYLGGLYVNDFNYLGRTYHVTAQADQTFRATPDSVRRFQTRSADGRMVPLGSVLDLQPITGPDRLNRYDLYLSAEVNGNAARGYSSGQALAAMEETAHQVLPAGYDIAWTDLSYQEKIAGNTALFIFPLCILFVWLTHSAEYESFALSTAIILIVPMCLLSGIAGVILRGMDNNIFTQIGFVVLAGMSVKNAVLIVEFAKQQQENHPRMLPAQAAQEAARLRLRPILMTSFAFIFGVVPLVFATGPGSEMRQALGTAVFYGMIGVTFFGIFLTPVFFDLIRTLIPHREHPGRHAHPSWERPW